MTQVLFTWRKSKIDMTHLIKFMERSRSYFASHCIIKLLVILVKCNCCSFFHWNIDNGQGCHLAVSKLFARNKIVRPFGHFLRKFGLFSFLRILLFMKLPMVRFGLFYFFGPGNPDNGFCQFLRFTTTMHFCWVTTRKSLIWPCNSNSNSQMQRWVFKKIFVVQIP